MSHTQLLPILLSPPFGVSVALITNDLRRFSEITESRIVPALNRMSRSTTNNSEVNCQFVNIDNRKWNRKRIPRLSCQPESPPPPTSSSSSSRRCRTALTDHFSGGAPRGVGGRSEGLRGSKNESCLFSSFFFARRKRMRRGEIQGRKRR